MSPFFDEEPKTAAGRGGPPGELLALQADVDGGRVDVGTILRAQGRERVHTRGHVWGAPSRQMDSVAAHLEVHALEVRIPLDKGQRTDRTSAVQGKSVD